MTQKKQKTTTKKVATKTVKKQQICSCAKEKQQLAQSQERVAVLTTGEDVRMAVLIVSVIINLFFLIAWVTLQVTSRYDVAVANMLFSR